VIRVADCANTPVDTRKIDHLLSTESRPAEGGDVIGHQTPDELTREKS
jgi:hypothetical protein